MAKKRLLWQLYPAYLAIALSVLAAMGWYAAHSLETSLAEAANRRLLAAAQAVDDAIGPKGPAAAPDRWRPLARAAAEASGVRINVIVPSGDVDFDSEREGAETENLLDRGDVRAALSGDADATPRAAQAPSGRSCW